MPLVKHMELENISSKQFPQYFGQMLKKSAVRLGITQSECGTLSLVVLSQL
ncbi:hypothetical protein A6R68_21070, partial [Neotoma lepida]